MQVRRDVEALPASDGGLARFYEGRGGRPLWVDGYRLRPDAVRLIDMLRAAGEDGLSPQAYGADALRRAAAAAEKGDPRALARAELIFSRAYAAYMVDLRRPPAEAEMVFTDPAVRPELMTVSRALNELALAPSLGEHLAAARRMNPIYEAYRRALPGATGADAALIRANMERARALPPDLGRRYILVDAAAARLWLYEGGRVVDSMPVAVGKPSQPTPMMAGMIRYLVFNPYWNVPPDLARSTLARRAAREGPAAVRAGGFEVLSDWSPAARPVALDEVDWTAAAAGGAPLRVRQRPGPQNMMGKVKLMFPNRFGVYLHDTPHRGVFDASQRAVSAGCVRLQDASRLAARLMDGAPVPTGSAPEQRVDLARPIPVYIVYFTLQPQPDGSFERRPDIYGRDRRLIAALEADRPPNG